MAHPENWTHLVSTGMDVRGNPVVQLQSKIMALYAIPANESLASSFKPEEARLLADLLLTKAAEAEAFVMPESLLPDFLRTPKDDKKPLT